MVSFLIGKETVLVDKQVFRCMVLLMSCVEIMKQLFLAGQYESSGSYCCRPDVGISDSVGMGTGISLLWQSFFLSDGQRAVRPDTLNIDRSCSKFVYKDIVAVDYFMLHSFYMTIHLSGKFWH